MVKKMELNEFIGAGFRVGMYSLLIWFSYYIVREGGKIAKSWSRVMKARAEKAEYSAVGEKLKVKYELTNMGIKEEEINTELFRLSGIISKELLKK